MAETSMSWAMPVMRAGYAGRGLVYLVVAGVSLWAIWHGGEAEGTSGALKSLENSLGGVILLFLIFAGMLCYMIWRLLDATYDLECYGSGGKGVVARGGMVATGLIHGGLGVLALVILFGGGDGDGSRTGQVVGWVLRHPLGALAVGALAVVILGAGAYYLKKAFAEDYRKHLRASTFTMNWNWVLKIGVAAQGVAILVIGGLLLAAAIQADPDKAGGVGTAFDWLSHQPYGRVLVSLLCAGFALFAVFCLVNAAYRVVPRVADPDVETLALRMKARAEDAMS